jgi:hypothetical protein
MPASSPVQISRERVAELTAREEARRGERTQRSAALYQRAKHSLSAGVASSYQMRDPWPIYLSHGAGPKVWDVDGNELYDFHNGFGSMVQGHAHPAIGHAIRERYEQGTHFAAPTEDAIVDDLDGIPVELRGLHRRNPVNLPSGGGVQIELPPRVRGTTPHWEGWEGPGHCPPLEALVAGLASAVQAWQP